MKYIKKFKESKEEYYIELNKVPYDGEISMSDQSANYIKKICKDINVSEVKNGMHMRSLYFVIYSPNDKSINIYIIELEDEYFIVYNIGVSRVEWVYKCDQVDGVKELLIDKGFIKE